MEKKKSIKNISMAVIRRLPKYHRYLKELMRNDIDRISSKELSERIGFTASKIRQDLSCFGEFGQHGYGYNVAELYNQINNILGLSKPYSTIIVGSGSIGQAIANYTNFYKVGFNLKAMFDINPKLIGIRIRDTEIMDIDYLGDYLRGNPVDIGVICTPQNNGQKVCDILVRNGVKGIWNFAPVDLIAPEGVKIENVHLVDSLLILSCLLKDD